jgi:hypothetical protein
MLRHHRLSFITNICSVNLSRENSHSDEAPLAASDLRSCCNLNEHAQHRLISHW